MTFSSKNNNNNNHPNSIPVIHHNTIFILYQIANYADSRRNSSHVLYFSNNTSDGGREGTFVLLISIKGGLHRALAPFTAPVGPAVMWSEHAHWGFRSSLGSVSERCQWSRLLPAIKCNQVAVSARETWTTSGARLQHSPTSVRELAERQRKKRVGGLKNAS